MRLIPPGRRKGNRFYLARGRIQGREYEVSTQTTDRERAKDFASAFERRIRDGDAARSREAATLSGAIRLYLEARRATAPEDRRLARIRADGIGRMALGDIRQADIDAAAWRLLPAAKPATRNRQVVAPIAAVLHYAADSGLCPYLRVRRFREPQPEARALRPRDKFKLIEAAAGAERALLVFLFYQGWRITETLRLDWAGVDLRARTARSFISKSGRWKTVPLHPAVFAALANLDGRTGRVFPWAHRWAVYRWLRPLAARAGIAFTPHVARHTFATDLHRAGADAKAIKNAGSWFSEKSVFRYTADDLDHAREIIGRLPTRGKTRGKTRKPLTTRAS